VVHHPAYNATRLNKPSGNAFLDGRQGGRMRLSPSSPPRAPSRASSRGIAGFRLPDSSSPFASYRRGFRGSSANHVKILPPPSLSLL